MDELTPYRQEVRGQLLVVATPLGNLDDFSPRAQAALREADLVACEDTRRTARLLARFGIDTPTVSCHRFNERERMRSLLERLSRGETIALVSDGGTPGISDPGSVLVGAALEAGIEVVALPGPCAVAAALSVSGLPADRYVFEGFLPSRAGERRRRMRELRSETRTIVMFEAPHRIKKCLDDMAQVLGCRPLVLFRELTKLHETVLRGSAEQIGRKLGDDVRGEITLVLAGAGDAAADDRLDLDAQRIVEVWRRSIEQHRGDRRPALREAARILGLKRPELNRRLAELQID